MSGFTVAQRNAFLDGLITGALDVALFTTAPDEEGVGGVEVSGGGYARVSHSSWNAAANGLKTNNGQIDFGDPSADWGTIVAIAKYSGATQVSVTTEFSTAVGSSATSVVIDDAGLIDRFLNT